MDRAYPTLKEYQKMYLLKGLRGSGMNSIFPIATKLRGNINDLGIRSFAWETKQDME
jgi:hypothetical protein